MYSPLSSSAISTKPRRGATLGEFGLIAVAIVLAVVAAITVLGGSVSGPFAEADSGLNGNSSGGSTPSSLAAFDADPAASVFGAPVQFTSTHPDATSWAWDFGDGNTSTEQNPTHTYATAGTYTVELAATGPGGTDTETLEYTVLTPEPVAGFTYSATPTMGSPVVFDADADPNATTYSWDFGDGNSDTGLSVSHTFSSAGTFSVVLTVNGPGGTDVDSQDVEVVLPPAPVADFSVGASPWSNGIYYEDDDVTFTSTSTGDITSYQWAADPPPTDGTFVPGATTANYTRTLNNYGTWTIRLTVTGPGGSDTMTKTVSVQQIPAAPVASFTMATSPYSSGAFCEDDSRTMTSTSTGVITSYNWEYDRPSAGTTWQTRFNHTSPTYNETFATSGVWTTRLTVTGPGGSSSVQQSTNVQEWSEANCS